MSEDRVIDSFVGNVSILLNNRVVLQGQIRPFPSIFPLTQQFIILELNRDAAIIRDNAQLAEINPPLYRDGDVVRINLRDISAIGPSNECPIIP